ncbi:MAG TPA: GNAT family N-acetyltransferase, partial [Oryzihumus sp.]|nr:GNAT family N-acetyltransferase [Oryzihumus sp.]
ELVRPHVRYHRSFLDTARELEAEGNGGYLDLGRHPLGTLESEAGFATYVQQLLAKALPETPRPAGHVPDTVQWVVDGGQMLGRVSIRHSLTPFLLEVGGHVGYAVRPSARGNGHATAALRLALAVARDLGIDPVLLTCDEDNTASRLVIERNGGTLEDVRAGKRRYWVATGNR